MDDERNENVEETTDETTEETTEENIEEKEDTIEEDNKYEDYADTDIIEMLRSIKEKVDGFNAAIDSIKETMAMFVENGATITDYDASNAGDEIVDEEFATEFSDIEDLDLSL